jgi:hypothetical protein
LSNGIPSHDTFNRFFSLLDAAIFEEAFLSWVRSVSSLTRGEVVSIDGKTVRGSRDSSGKHAIHMVIPIVVEFSPMFCVSICFIFYMLTLICLDCF